MRWDKIFSIPERILITLKRDYKLLIIILISPLIILTVFSVSYKPDIGQIKIGFLESNYVKTEQIDIAQSIKVKLSENIKDLKIIEYSSFDKAKNDLKTGSIDGFIEFPADLNQFVFLKLSGMPLENPAQVKFYEDSSNKLKSTIILQKLENSVIQISQSFGIEPAFLISKQSIYSKNITQQDFWTAGIIGFSIFVLSLIFSISLTSLEKSSGIYETIISSSMSSFEILFGYFISYLFINFLQILILLLIYILFFKGIFSLSVVLIFVFMLILSACGSLLGILLSNLTSTIRSFQIAVLIMLISLFISGIFWPISTLPDIGKIISYLFPTSFAIDAIRSIVIRESNFINILPSFVFLLGFLLLYFFIGLISIRKSVK